MVQFEWVELVLVKKKKYLSSLRIRNYFCSTSSRELRADNMELLLSHEEEILSILKTRSPISLSNKLSENEVISQELNRKFTALDLEHLDPDLLLRYLLYHVYESVAEDKLVYYSFADVLSELGEERMKSKLRKELYLYKQRESFKILNQSSPYDKDKENSRKRAREEYLEGFCLCEYDAPILAEVLAESAYKWKELAVWLQLSPNQIEECQKESSLELKLFKVLLEFIKNNCEYCTLNSLELALKSNLVSLYNEGCSLKDNFIGRLECSKKRCLSYDFRPFRSGDVKVDSGKAALLGFQVTTATQGSYQWSRNGQPLSDSEVYSGTRSAFMFISSVSRNIVGEYKCLETSTNSSYKVTLTTYISRITQKFIDIYCNWPDIPKERWPPVSNTQFVNLALISKAQQTNDQFSYTIQDNIDDIEGLKSNIDYEDVFGKYESGHLILVEGRPGSGKTTLMHKVTKDWAKRGNVLVDAEVVVLVSLRLFKALCNRDMTLSSMLKRYLENDEERISFINSIKEQNGKGLCIIIDGVDEYEDVKSADNIISELIYKLTLPLSMVIVASRPVGTAEIRRTATITHHIEVLGFTKEQIRNYVNFYFKECEDTSIKVWKYLTLHTNVLRMCYTPVHAAMVCFLYEEEGDQIPHTETKIYENFTISTLLRKTHREKTGPLRITALKDLKGNIKIYFDNICKLALDMTLRNQQVIYESKTNFPLSPPNSDKGSLGLVTIDSTAKRLGVEDLYTFFHLTFQEFLAAIHLTTLEDENSVIEEVKECRGNLQMVWKFYCGLVQFREHSLVLESIMSDQNRDILYKAQCAFESQQQEPCNMLLNKAGTNTLSFKDRIFIPSDFLAISYVISSSSEHTVTTLSFTECTLNEEGVLYFLEKMEDVHRRNITQLSYQKKKCTIPEFVSLGYLLEQLSSIELIDLENTPMGVEGVKKLGKCDSLPNLKTIKIAVPFKSGSDDSMLFNILKFKSPELKIVYYNIVKKSYKIDSDKLISTLLKVFSGIILWSCNLQSLLYYNGDFVTFHQSGIYLLERCLKLGLVNCSITDEDVSLLVESLSICANLTTLHLDFNRITDIGARTLSNSLQKLSRLTTLSAHCNEIGDCGAICIVHSAVEFNNKIKFLDLQCNLITEEGLQVLINSIDVSKAFQLYVTSQRNHSMLLSNLQLVQTSVNNICANPEDAKGIRNALRCCRCCPEIHINGDINSFVCFINVHGVTESDNAYFPLEELKYLSKLLRTLNLESKKGKKINSTAAVAMADFLRSCTKLQTLKFNHNSIGSEGAEALADSLRFCTELQTLNLWDNNIGSEGAIALADSLSYCTELQTLNLGSNSIGSKGAIALADSLRSCTKLQTLNLFHNNIGSEGAIALGDNLMFCTKLQAIKLSRNIIGSVGVIALAVSLRSCTKLQTLDLIINSIGSEGAIALADSLRFCTKLQTLHLGDNSIGSEGAIALADSLRSCTKVQTLDLFINSIGSEGAIALADSLRFCTKLQTLHLGDNSIGSEGAIALADSLRSCTKLQTLHLGDNSIGSEGAIALADSLRFCTELQTLNLRHNSIGLGGATALADSLRSCTELQTLKLEGNKIGSKDAEALAKPLRSCCTKLKTLHL